jgi:ActR/RegA family two-component response regulator
MTSRLDNEAETLLVLDDDEAIRKLEARTLNKLGYKVLPAAGPVEALANHYEPPL